VPTLEEYLVDLEDDFRPKVRRLLEACEKRGQPMRVFYSLRHPLTQAKLYRQSRPWSRIERAIEALQAAGAPFAAECLIEAGPQSGRWATNAVPGNSWHQSGEAVDAGAWVLGTDLDWPGDGDPPAERSISWDTQPGAAGGPGDAFYRGWSSRAQGLGLTALGPSLGDWVHVQARAESSPSKVFSWPEIDARLRDRFAD
jgi:hypothetical protein